MTRALSGEALFERKVCPTPSYKTRSQNAPKSVKT
jgi:hypothetical protein